MFFICVNVPCALQHNNSGYLWPYNHMPTEVYEFQSYCDTGKGRRFLMSKLDFTARWNTLDYNAEFQTFRAVLEFIHNRTVAYVSRLWFKLVGFYMFAGLGLVFFKHFPTRTWTRAFRMLQVGWESTCSSLAKKWFLATSWSGLTIANKGFQSTCSSNWLQQIHGRGMR